MKTITAYQDDNGVVHTSKDDCLRADAQKALIELFANVSESARSIAVTCILDEPYAVFQILRPLASGPLLDCASDL